MAASKEKYKTDKNFCRMLEEYHVNCSIPSLMSYPYKNIFSDEESIWFTIVNIIMCSYFLVAIAIVCDSYFVPSVEILTDVVPFEKDVIGASLMAISTSTPELFINIIGTFVSESDLGLSTILGSVAFNLFFIIACIAFVMSAKETQVNVWSFTRECIMSLLSISLILYILSDSLVPWYEALFLVILYMIYFLTLFFDKNIKYLCNYCCKISEHIETHEEVNNSYENINHILYPAEKNVTTKIWWLITIPIRIVFFLTIPDCKKNRNLFVLTLMLSVVHLSIQTYLLTLGISLISRRFNVTASMMGMTILAIGSSIPEVFSCIILAKKGYTGMSISNAIGSNTFDTLICLGLPWLIKATIFLDCPNLYVVYVNSKGLLYAAMGLLMIIIIFYGIFWISAFRLTFIIGIESLIFFITFLIIAILLEFDVFYSNNLPYCSY